MSTKIYISVLVVIILCFLQLINIGLRSVDKKYYLQKKYSVPISCGETAICGISGNIFLLWIIYLLIPERYFDELSEILDPKKMHQTAARYM
jgi:hypothetical protein